MAEPAPVTSALPTTEDVIPAPQETPAASESTNTIPDEVLELPAVAGLLHGAPPAVYTERANKSPEVQTVIKHIKPLEEAGFGIYNSADKKLAVLYNSSYVSQEEIAKADKAGTLTELVPSLESVQAQFNSAISGEATPAGAGLPGSPVAGPAPSGPPPSSRTQNTLATARTKALQLGSPTSGPKPGAGRLLNSILKPTI